MGNPKTFTLFNFISLYFTIKLIWKFKVVFLKYHYSMKCLLWQLISPKINKNGQLLFKIFHLKVWEKHILSPKIVWFWDKMVTLATDISINKQARANFLIDSSRTNIVLLRSNKKLTSGPLFITIFHLKVWEKYIFFAKKCVFLWWKAYFGSSYLKK